MYQLIEIYGDNEPWWFFDDWREDIQSTILFEEFEEAKIAYERRLKELQKHYTGYRTKETFLTAFWNQEELRYCVSCEEDVQQFKGLLLLKNEEKIKV